MRSEVERDGLLCGFAFIRDAVREGGQPARMVCADCKRERVCVPVEGADPLCERCWVAHIDYCEYRWGTVTETFRGVGIGPRPRIASAYLRGVFRGVRQGFRMFAVR